MKKPFTFLAIILNGHIVLINLLNQFFIYLNSFIEKGVSINSIFSSLYIYFVFTFYLLLSWPPYFYAWLLLVPLSTIIALIYNRRSKLKYFFLLGMIAYGYFLLRFYNYQPGISFKEGIRWHLADEPLGLERMRKHICAWAECKTGFYQIVGWQDETTLIYKKWEKRQRNVSEEKWVMVGEGTISAYKFGGVSNRLNSLPETSKNLCEFNDCVMALVKNRQFVGNPKVWISPDGQKLAFIAEHLYGPQDIIVVEKN